MPSFADMAENDREAMLAILLKSLIKNDYTPIKIAAEALFFFRTWHVGAAITHQIQIHKLKAPKAIKYNQQPKCWFTCF